MPPGPPSLPIVGNAHQLKPINIFEQFRNLSERYGPLASLKIGSNNIVVIGGDGTLVRELLDKRGAIYSNRPLELVNEIAGNGDHLLFQRDTDKWRTSRKLIVQHYTPRISKTEHVCLQEAESIQLMHDFLHQPKQFMGHVMRYTTSVVTCLNYGVRCTTYQDPAVRGIERIMEELSALNLSGAKPPVEAFPWLWYLPDFMMIKWKSRAKKIGEIMDKVYGDLAEIGRERGINGLNTNTLANKLRLSEESSGLTAVSRLIRVELVSRVAPILLVDRSFELDELKLISLTGCGSDLYMHISVSRNPLCKRCLYDEETLPRWEDEQKMPFIRAMVKEVLRWRPPIPAGLPHRLEQGKPRLLWGIFSPKDSTIIYSTWTIHSNPDRYAEPHLFKPERFLDDKMSMAQSTAQTDPLKRDHYAFGADSSGLLNSQPLPAAGQHRPECVLWETVRRPKPFEVVITPRSAKRVATIEREMELAKQNVFSLYGTYDNN
ncbi:Cytochrome P450 [Rhizoctonia solani]|uniref:Cytochrome P450 n=1 Tax=Rhizoctonia solani TaxID=456999 RepID=A0A8H7I845_9AGAM|nr:Cytochrome P450 [Rhizoctonia solani]